MMKNPWQTLHIEEVYDNPWIKVTHRDVINPAGKPGIYGLVHFKNLAIGIVPIDHDQHTWLVGQYRYTLDRYTWEIPEGGCPLGTDPLASARRELKEETGIEAAHWTHLLDLHPSNSVTDEAGMAYIAQELTLGEPEPEETEDLQVRRLPLTEAIRLVMDNQITDGLSMAALLKVSTLLQTGHI